MKQAWVFIFILLSHSLILAQDQTIPSKVEEELLLQFKKLEDPVNIRQKISAILKYDSKYIEFVIFQKIDDIEKNKANVLHYYIEILGNLESERAVLTLAKFIETSTAKSNSGEIATHPRHIRVAAMKALLSKLTEERIKVVIKCVKDNDPIFQSIVLKALQENKIKESAENAFAVFKNEKTETHLSVKTDAASLILTVSDDPLLKNNVLLAMLQDPNIHMRKAGMTLLPEGGLPGDSEIRQQILKSLKTAKQEELDLLCQSVGTLRIKEAQEELLHLLDKENSPLLKWQCLYSLFKIGYSTQDLQAKIQKLIQAYTVNPNIKNADQERFIKLSEIIQSEAAQ